MPEKPAAERTEEATPERLRKAREEGQIPHSAELPSAILIAALLLCLGLLSRWAYRWSAGQVRIAVSIRPLEMIGPGGLLGILRGQAIGALTTALPFLLAAAAASVFASLLAGGWAFSPKAVQLKFERISPARGLKNLFSGRAVVRLLICLLKLTAILVIVGLYLKDKLAACCALRWATPEGTLVAIARLVFGLLGRMTVAVLVIAGIDLLYQRRKYRKDLRMTRQESKEERKQYELSPETKGRIRGLQITLASRRMLQEVPQADVVVTNPTHVAVALKYDSKTMDAPHLLAKGADLLAEKIKEIARDNDVPIVERPELARTIYAAVEIGQPIPEAMFVAVAEVLAMIYRLRRRRSGV
jgi:flagellar biosynthetic protein FlhB